MIRDDPRGPGIMRSEERIIRLLGVLRRPEPNTGEHCPALVKLISTNFVVRSSEEIAKGIWK